MKRITKIEQNKQLFSKRKVAAYCRVSTGEDAQLLSLETQKAHYESWIRRPLLRRRHQWNKEGFKTSPDAYDEGLRARFDRLCGYKVD